MKSSTLFSININKKIGIIFLILIFFAMSQTNPALSENRVNLNFKPVAFDLNTVENQLTELMADWEETAFTVDDVLVRHVSYFIKYYTVQHVDKSNKIIRRSEKYLHYIKKTFKKYGIAEEVAFALPFVESGFNTDARSDAGALGMFQFLDGTAIHYGLEIMDNGLDERTNYKKSAVACAKYLRNNRRVFASTVLSIASYHHGTQLVTDVLLNCGDDPGRTFGPIFKSSILGPFSREYIPQCLAAALIYRYLKQNRLVMLPVPGFESKILQAGTSVKSLKKKSPSLYQLNPDLQHATSIYPYAVSNGYILLTKIGKPALTAKMVRTYPDWAKNPDPNPDSGSTKIKGLPKTIHYVVQTHNDLSGISGIFGTSVKVLKFGNRFLVKQDGLHSGDVIKINGMAPTTRVLDGDSIVCGKPGALATREDETLEAFCKRVVKTIRADCASCPWQMGANLSPALIYYWNHDVLGAIQPDTPLAGGLSLKIYSDYRWHKTPVVSQVP
ncbi:lytic murein transglycosylase [Desulfobacter hydrogenophilus]|uniref:Lytic murein transglycosylase n=1 Tax=Desulfobacter hydrogenophilus TaxID=2291 RepID=A0A328FC47_9BACT|nr:transglycosylase SLT domain-containing protein [Desulfobacter hydrogenophilus]NDY72205.1 transglycosylase SLT domain-containing protein [Desulfobacter hydrogenophilus]QBH15114.1 lytic murein transglycosylase [Desulfobacter hydrogenophilus]RAM02211.1 lytic murein transglycosylase [Desulfobacter hydrogenophilus]